MATQLFYQHTPIDSTIYEKFVFCNYKLNTLTDVPYQMTVSGAFVYVRETCERGRVKDFEQWSCVYNAFFSWTRRPCYNGVAVYKQLNFDRILNNNPKLQCSSKCLPLT